MSYEVVCVKMKLEFKVKIRRIEVATIKATRFRSKGLFKTQTHTQKMYSVKTATVPAATTADTHIYKLLMCFYKRKGG